MSPPVVPNLMIVTPNYPPAVGGSAVYARILAEGSIDRNLVENVTVLTEAHPACPPEEIRDGGRLRLERRLPYRAGRPERSWRSYPAYAGANLQLLRLAWRPCRPGTVLLFHGSLLRHPSILPLILGRLRRRQRNRPRLVADLRDPLLGVRRQRHLRAFDAVIACSARVTASLRHGPACTGRVREIPIPFDTSATPAPDPAVLTRHGLTPGGYVFWTNGISDAKNLGFALEAVRQLRARGRSVTLAVAGRCRDWTRFHTCAQAGGHLRYLGAVPHAQMPALYAGAGAVLNVSAIEGLPRACLEAIAAGAPVLLPPNVPEFAAACPDHLAAIRDPGMLATQIEAALDGRLGPAPYPLERHASHSVLPQYAGLFQELFATGTGG